MISHFNLQVGIYFYKENCLMPRGLNKTTKRKDSPCKLKENHMGIFFKFKTVTSACVSTKRG